MPLNRKILTLDEFTIQQLRDFPHATGELSNLLRDLGLAAKRVNVEVNKAGLVDILGDAGSINVQGEDVKKLDVFANEQFMGVLRHGISCAGIASEELDDYVAFDDAVSRNSKYVCLFDPLDGSGNMTGYRLRGVGINSGNPTRQDNFPSGAVDNLLIDSVEHASPITTGAWRAPITNFLAFAEQSFLDEVAQAAGKDPVEFRLNLLQKARTSPAGEIKYDIGRMEGVIKMAADKAGWGTKKGVFQGFSVYFSHRSYVAQVCEVTMEKGKPAVKKIYAVADCGEVVNLSGARQQVMGGVVDGYGHAMFGKLTFKNGETEQKNYNTYRLIRMKEVPEVEPYFVDNGIEPTGLGEPALPPTGGAVANAIFKATGKRIKNQPFNDDELFGGKKVKSTLKKDRPG